MSTFDGVVKEFPEIQIDYFRKNQDKPPLACFLSHVHSDHLQGLESFRSPFIYCSAATKELLLRIEKYPHRMNFNKGILEARRLHYKHLSKLLRPIPLDTPTEIELTPRVSIRVTLLDANHCTGAVMFLIEGDGKAILYTGDIRAETWWVNSLVRHPVLIPYTLGKKSLDNMYIDNTFARQSHIYRSFPSKAEGLAELLQKVTSYPQNTVFYFRAWTFGYEEVWTALSAALDSKIHVDRYQMGIYKALTSPGKSDGIAASLCGFALGNRVVTGCLSDDENAHVHSCEPGLNCPVLSSEDTVFIIPIVNRAKDGAQLPEIGTGGGGGDLYQTHELELPDQSALDQLDQLCLERTHDPHALEQVRKTLAQAFWSKSRTLSLDSYGIKDVHDMPLEHLVNVLSRGSTDGSQWESREARSSDPLPKIIHFPYSRHSSYAELCELVAAFHPKEVFPCTVDPVTWDEDDSMERLFGHLCTGTDFSHDNYMRGTSNERQRKRLRLSSSGMTMFHQKQQPASQQHNTPPITTTPSPSPSPAHPNSHPALPNTLAFPTSNKTTRSAKHDEIRLARRFLQNNNNNNNNPPTGQETHFELESLPSSWTSSSNNTTTSQNQTQPNIDPPDPHSKTPSISSAFASQDQQQQQRNPRNGNNPEWPIDDLELDYHDYDSNRETQVNPRRHAAYLAARADSYDAWADVGLVSAGDNHCVEEVEL
ncbi:beta-lactamase-like protein [Aspergillus taichungensis]|uniref:Protein artemis n=1 Tax=Aspergillus taichungensis TaxID=482145 RepID=A0A2J5I5D1_9EURO|nr:beta-lactamase-like protein [Aspergillus taichungensis]